MDVLHTAIWVSDLEEAQSFFVDELGLETTNESTNNGVENVYVGGSNGEIQLRYDPERPGPDPERATIDHIAIATSDVTDKAKHLTESSPWDVVTGPVTLENDGVRVAFVEGPDGYVFELIADLE
jgi:lactoylglutathione lyase